VDDDGGVGQAESDDLQIDATVILSDPDQAFVGVPCASAGTSVGSVVVITNSAWALPMR